MFLFSYLFELERTGVFLLLPLCSCLLLTSCRIYSLHT
jgi:hypothetical protein